VIRGFDTKTYELSIYNRWGDRVFFTENPEEPWTGNVGQGDYYVQNDVFNWQLKLVAEDSTEEVFYSGSIILIR
ncbi:MAG: gliding motility-associated C-terminal domain-containing protein, partial [Flavobacteriales bacterium]